jgi:signal transduction histidine kinase
MKNKNKRYIFKQVSLKYKILFYVLGLVLFITALFILTIRYLPSAAYPWIGIIILMLSIFLSYVISQSVTNYIKKAAELINEHKNGNFNNSNDVGYQNEFLELETSLINLSDSMKFKIEEKISNENLAMMGEFAAFIIHDLKNPISGIHLLAEGLNKKISDNDDLKKYSNEILLASQKLDDFIKRTLDITKPTSLNTQPININHLIKNVTNEINVSEIEIETRFDESIPEITGDYELLSRAITNIINNAIESIEIEGKIIIETKKEKILSIKISDNGKGINETDINTIFRPFYSSKGKGHGLGLAMAKKAILMHSGSIQVDSKTGRGSIFTISLPVMLNPKNNSFNLKEKE